MSWDNENDDQERTWKNYPIMIKVDGLSYCCEKPRILMQSMQGGYVTANCLECNRKNKVTDSQFGALDLLVICPDCGDEMASAYVDYNYGFKCSSCHRVVSLYDMLPHWTSRRALAKT